MPCCREQWKCIQNETELFSFGLFLKKKYEKKNIPNYSKSEAYHIFFCCPILLWTWDWARVVVCGANAIEKCINCFSFRHTYSSWMHSTRSMCSLRNAPNFQHHATQTSFVFKFGVSNSGNKCCGQAESELNIQYRALQLFHGAPSSKAIDGLEASSQHGKLVAESCGLSEWPRMRSQSAINCINALLLLFSFFVFTNLKF